MNDHERYLFDLNGYLVVPDALTPEQVANLNSVLDEHIAAECPPDMRTHRFVPLLDWSKDYRDLIDNPAVYGHLKELLGRSIPPRPRLSRCHQVRQGPDRDQPPRRRCSIQPHALLQLPGRDDAQRPFRGCLQPEGCWPHGRRLRLRAGLAQEQLQVPR